MDDIKLKTISELEERKLPKDIYVMQLGEQIIFLRKIMGRLMPVSPKEQTELWQQFRPL